MPGSLELDAQNEQTQSREFNLVRGIVKDHKQAWGRPLFSIFDCRYFERSAADASLTRLGS